MDPLPLMIAPLILLFVAFFAIFNLAMAQSHNRRMKRLHEQLVNAKDREIAALRRTSEYKDQTIAAHQRHIGFLEEHLAIAKGKQRQVDALTTGNVVRLNGGNSEA